MSNTRKAKKPNIHAQRVSLAERYFAEHPHALAFTRPVTPAEQRTFNMPPGTVVRVIRTDTGFTHGYATPPAG